MRSPAAPARVAAVFDGIPDNVPGEGSRAVPMRAGDRVRVGQVLGLIGNSGSSDGPHLHFHVTEAASTEEAPRRGEECRSCSTRSTW